MKHLRILAIVFGSLLLARGALAQQPPPRQGQAERFERNMEQIRQQTLIRANTAIPPDQRVTLDYGGILSFGYLSIDDNVGNTHGLRQSEFVGYARANFDGAHEFFLRYRTGYRDYNMGDSFGIFINGKPRGDEPIDGDLDAAYYKFDLARYQAAYNGKTTNNNVVFKGGRDLVYWANGLTLSQTIDGAVVDLTYDNFTASFIAGETPTRSIDYDSSRPSFDYNTKRGFFGAMFTTQAGNHRPFVYALWQRDYNEPEVLQRGTVTTRFDYNSWYVGFGSSGTLSDRLLYGVEAVYEGGRSLSNSFTLDGSAVPAQVEQVHDDIQAWAADARIDYLLADEHRTRLSAEFVIASGDDDRNNTNTTFDGNRPGTNDHAFNGFGLLNTGLAFAPTVSNLIMLRVGGSTFPLDFHPSLKRAQFGTDFFLFCKLNTDGGIDEPSDDSRFLGWEPDVYLNWQITSDVTFAVRYGVFFPDSSSLRTSDLRQFLFLNVTYSF